jgi:hypothetical protein
MYMKCTDEGAKETRKERREQCYHSIILKNTPKKAKKKGKKLRKRVIGVNQGAKRENLHGFNHICCIRWGSNPRSIATIAT